MKIFFRLVTVAVFLVILAVVIAYARGYRLDFQKQSVSPNGILAITSSPKTSKVYINGQLKGITDMNTTLSPGNYSIEIKKDGYTSYTKNVALKGELVMSVDGLLFPVNPSLSPLTNLGIVKAIPLDQTNKLLIFSQSEDEAKDGIYLFEVNQSALSLFPPLKPIILRKDLPGNLDLKDTNVYFSPDYKQAIVEFLPTNISYLLNLDEQNSNPINISSSQQTLLYAWQKEKDQEKNKILETFPKQIAKVASDSFHIVSYSPDDTRILYQAIKSIPLPLAIVPRLIATNQTTENRELKKNSLYVYDKKEDRNYEIRNSKFEIRNFSPLWYPDSKHLTFVENNKVSVVDYDGQNTRTVYSGPFDNSFFTLTPDGKIAVLINLNPDANKFPDLYLVGIR
jgi:hypothetical protein